VQFWILIFAFKCGFRCDFRSSAILPETIFFIKNFSSVKIIYHWTLYYRFSDIKFVPSAIKEEEIGFLSLLAVITLKHRVKNKICYHGWRGNSEKSIAITWSDFYDYLSYVAYWSNDRKDIWTSLQGIQYQLPSVWES